MFSHSIQNLVEPQFLVPYDGIICHNTSSDCTEIYIAESSQMHIEKKSIWSENESSQLRKYVNELALNSLSNAKQAKKYHLFLMKRIILNMQNNELIKIKLAQNIITRTVTYKLKFLAIDPNEWAELYPNYCC